MKRALAVLVITLASCTSTTPLPAPQRYTPTAQQSELDDIYTLLAYSVVYKNWQRSLERGESRGYNIGAVLVDGSNDVVCWAVNSVYAAGNNTHHAETRLMTNYLSVSKQPANLSGYTVYTTLEPCAMCSGMMTMQSVAKTIYGQRDPMYGAALERLAIDSTPVHGYPPYPRTVMSAEATNRHTRAIDAAYHQYSTSEGSPRIIRWLATPEARALYEGAVMALEQYTVTHPENQRHLDHARAFLKTVPATYQAIPYTSNCGLTTR